MSPDPYNAGADPMNPQSWNMYSYVNNNPLNAVDPSGKGVCDDLGQEACLVAASQCNAYQGLGECETYNSNLQCQIDGVSSDCGDALQGLQSGFTAQCPENQCGVTSLTNPNGDIGLGIYQAPEGGTPGYQMLTPWFDPVLALIATPAQLDAGFSNQRDTMAAALKKAGAANGDVSQFLTDNARRGTLLPVGGNFDFNDAVLFTYLFNCPHERCDEGSLGTIDFSHDNGTFHLDTADPWNIPLGSLLHGWVDAFLGNYWYAFIPR